MVIAQRKVSYFFIFIAFLMSMRCWIGFEGRKTIYFYVLPILLLLLHSIGWLRIIYDKRYLIFALLVFFSELYVAVKAKGHIDINSIISRAIPSVTIYQLLCISDDEKDFLLKTIVRWFGLIMIPGIIIYLITFVVPLPSFGIIKTHYGGDFYGTPCLNYLFYIKPIEIGTTDMFRYNGPFIEPGDLGNVVAFMLVATKFDFRKYKYLWIALVSLILSFSLSGYVLTAFGYVLTLFVDKKISFKYILVGGSVVLFLSLLGTNYNGGDNYINKSILSRLSEDNFDVESANGRTTVTKMLYFWNMWQDPKVLLTGYDNQTIEYLNEEGVGAGFANSMIAVGLIGIVSMVLPYLYLSLTSNRKKYAFLVFIMLLLYMYSRTNVFWYSIVICVVYGLRIHEKSFDTGNTVIGISQQKSE